MKNDKIISKGVRNEYWLRKVSSIDEFFFPRENTGDRRNNWRFVEFQMDGYITGRVNSIAKGNEMTEYIVYLSFFGILLHRYWKKPELLISTPGMNTALGSSGKSPLLFFKLNVKESDSLKKVLQDTRKEVQESLGWKDYDYDRLKEHLERKGFDVGLLNYIGFFDHRLNTESSEFDMVNLQLMLEDTREQTFKWRIKFNDTYFEENFIRQLASHYQTLLSYLHTDLDETVGNLEILSGTEKRRLLFEFNRTKAGYPAIKTIHRLFEEQVDKTPDSIALSFESKHLKGGRQFTYRELNGRADRWARFLRGKGAGTESIIGLMLSPSIEMVIAILGILKAGGAYLPIAPDTPEERVLAVLDDARPLLLLTETGVVETFSYTALQGLSFIQTPPHVTARRPQIRDFDRLPFPDRSLVSYEKYNRYIGLAMAKNTVAIQGTRGCPYNCAYCHKIWPKSHVVRSAENLFAEVQLYYNMGIRRFVIVDDIFNLNKKNSSRFFRLIVENGLDLQLFFPNGVRGDILTEEYIDLMVRAGTTSIAFALETASPRLQKLIRKNLDLEKLRENIRYFCEKYPRVILELFTMHGFPTETGEEALMTLDFIKSLKWLHFPYVHILKIYPNTDMAALALDNGIPNEAITRSANLAYHELPETLPFDKNFSVRFQADFLSEYFLSKERLLHVLPHQVKVLTEDEVVQKYDSYLPGKIERFSDILALAGISEEEWEHRDFLDEDCISVPFLDKKIREAFPQGETDSDALRVLFLDLSQFFSHDDAMLYDVVEPPLGLMYVMTYLKQQLGPRVNGRIGKSRIDFDDYEGLKTLLEEFKPDIIGIRTLTFYKDFFHKTAAMIRHWGIDVPIIAGGPYATSDFETILQDRNVDLVVLSEGEITACELLRKMIENGKKLPPETVLKEIPGLAFLPRPPGAVGSRNLTARELLMVDALGEIPGDEPGRSPEPIHRPSNLAYVIYTSGSTGKPKGVMVEHLNVVRLMINDKNRFNFNHRDVWTMFHSYCFDFSVWEMYGALLYGGKLVVMTGEIARDPNLLLTLLENRQVTVLNQIPSIFNNLAAAALRGNEKRELSLRYVIFGGDALKPSLLKEWAEVYTGVKLVNMYGITETTVHVTYKEIGGKEIERGKSSIGGPIPTLACYIMDENLGLEPPGIEGEIVVGGDGVSRGYLNRPALTREKFKINPYVDGERLYRSGDLGKRLPGGDIEFLGRIDNQVKIRGYRVECGEIESRLVGFETIEEAMVIAREDKDGGKYLAAYFTAREEIGSAECRTYLERILPGYMIPTFFVQLEKFPLTSSGKINKKALPEPSIVDVSEALYEEPRNDLERELAKIWEEVLGVEGIGVNDDFFSLGGNSIKGIHIVNKIQELLEEIVHVTVLFEAPTINELAAKLEIYKRSPDSIVDEAKVAKMREIIKPLQPLPTSLSSPKNPPVLFLLSAPRCGSTLMRVILAGHLGLFAPPELELMLFNTLQDRKKSLIGRFSYFLEGTIRAIMEIKKCSLEEAAAIMKGFEDRDFTVPQFYGVMQEWLGEKLLVDKTPYYTLDPGVLKRMEEYFENPRYIYLYRNPYAAVHSYEEAKMDQLFRFDHDFSVRELAELMWLVCNRNIEDFLREIPGERKHMVRFEELVRNPGPVARGICDFLELPYHEEMIRVYEAPGGRMTDGVRPESKMLGDIKFFSHTTINADVIDNWRNKYKTKFLGAPTVELANRLGYLREELPVEPNEYSKIEPTPEAEHYEVSHAQRRLWISARLEKDQISYNIPTSYLVEGDLDIDVLEKAHETVVRRHGGLRTIFITIDKKPRQKIHDFDGTRFKVEYIDLRNKDNRDTLTRDIVEKDGAAPFNLEKGPLLRTILIHLEEKRFVLLFTMHHVVTDGWSMRLLLKELLTLYKAYKENRENPLPPLRLQYKDFSEWQKRTFGAEIIENQEKYWLNKFKDNIPVLDWSTLCPGVSAPVSDEGDAVRFLIDEELTGKLRDVLKKTDKTIFMFLLAVFNILLAKYTGQEDIVVVSPITGRRHIDLHNIIGMFVNMLTMRSRPEAEKRFEEFLEEIKETCLEAYANQDYQFEELVKKLGIRVSGSRNPLIKCVFTMQNIDFGKRNIEEANDLDDLSILPYGYERNISIYDLHLTASEGKNHIDMSIEYSTHIFKRSMVQNMTKHFVEILRHVLEDQGIKLLGIEISYDLVTMKPKKIIDDRDFNF